MRPCDEPIDPAEGIHRRAPERRSSYREVFVVREFRWLWIAQVLSADGPLLPALANCTSAIGNITYQTSQIVGFVTGTAVVATVDSYRTLGIDALSFGISALSFMTAVRARPAAQRTTGKRPTMWSVSAEVAFASCSGIRRCGRC